MLDMKRRSRLQGAEDHYNVRAPSFQLSQHNMTQLFEESAADPDKCEHVSAFKAIFNSSMLENSPRIDNINEDRINTRGVLFAKPI
jgi:hypothetical protein